ncbi:tRNA (guanine(9)-N(1))-methyltransferase [Actinomortierella ambigua]|nr:tRNA (guanine(9)-N(1))-methyltransferase [Actinomortierella ambigua]
MEAVNENKDADKVQSSALLDTTTNTTTTITASEEATETSPAIDTPKSADDKVNEHPKAKYFKPKPEPILGPNGEVLSKNQQKKLRKQQEFLMRKSGLKEEEKRKRKLKAQKRRDAVQAGLMPLKVKRSRLEQEHTGVTIGIDMAFDDLMLDKEIKSMVDQIKRCYACNKGAPKIFHLALTSFTGPSKTEFVARANGYELWRNFDMHERSLEEVWPSEEMPGKQVLERLAEIRAVASAKSEEMKYKALAEKAAAAAVSSSSETTEAKGTTEMGDGGNPPSTAAAEEPALDIEALKAMRLKQDEMLATVPAVNKIVYLSADSPNVISTLDPGTCYVLGGIVDKNRYPRLCQEKAEKLGIETAQLPIGEYIKMSSRRVLTVNQVLEILVQFVETKDWKEAFLKVIPQRKLEEKKWIKRGTAEWDAKFGRRSNTNSVTSNDGDSDVGENEGEEEDAEDEIVDDDEEGNVPMDDTRSNERPADD